MPPEAQWKVQLSLGAGVLAMWNGPRGRNFLVDFGELTLRHGLIRLGSFSPTTRPEHEEQPAFVSVRTPVGAEPLGGAPSRSSRR